MAAYYTMTPEQRAGWQAWVVTRPDLVRGMCQRWPLDRLYMLKTTIQRVTMVSYNENGTVTVSITGRFNYVAYDREVFGIDPNDLVECDLPLPGEKLGTKYTTDEDIKAWIDFVRPQVLAGRGVAQIEREDLT